MVHIMSNEYFHANVSWRWVREIPEKNVKSGRLMQSWNIDLIYVPEAGENLCMTDDYKPLPGVESKAQKILNEV